MKEEETMPDRYSEGVELIEYWRVIWKRRVYIMIIAVLSVLSTGIYAVFMEEDVYQASAIIVPVSEKGNEDRIPLSAQQLGMIGLFMPAPSSSAELVNTLNSNILKRELIERYNLLPVLFSERWDERKGGWKKEERGGFKISSLIDIFLSAIRTRDRKGPGQDGPTMWDGVRKLNSLVKVINNAKDNTIEVSAQTPGPELSAKLAGYILAALNNHMSGEAKRTADSTRRYLEGQLRTTTDPFIRQKIYNLIARQIEISMMSEVKENFAFKTIDPPEAPDRKIAPNRLRMVSISLALSLFAGVFLSFFLEHSGRAKSRRK